MQETLDEDPSGPLSPSLRAALSDALRALPGCEFVLLSNLYGLPILRAAAPASAPAPAPARAPLEPEPLETIFATVFAMTAEQLEKLSLGRASALVAGYGSHVVVQSAMHPLVLALVARDGAAGGADVDAMLAALPALHRVLEPVRARAEELLSQ
jgi:hypothetical protein